MFPRQSEESGSIRFGRNSRWWYESKKKGKARQATGKGKQRANEKFIKCVKGTEGILILTLKDKHTEQPDLTLGNVDCVRCIPNNISSHLGTIIRNKDDNQNIMCSANYFLPQPQSHPHPVYYQHYMPTSQTYTLPGWHISFFNQLFCFVLCKIQC